MSIAKTYSAQLFGLSPEKITIEVDISNGLHSFSIVGLGDRSIEEAKDRISAAIKNNNLVSPKQKNQKIIISLVPADIKKEGPSFDLGMTMAYLLSSGQVNFDSEDKLFLGELTLEGKLRKINGILPILCQAKNMGFKEAYIPFENFKEASLAQNINIYPSESLKQIISHLQNTTKIKPITQTYKKENEDNFNEYDISMIRGNETAKRGLEIAAAGGHNVILYGPPGTGKTLLAKCFSTLLPSLNYEESIEVTGIHSISQNLTNGFITKPPFRAPHHTASYPSIVGGGNFPKPGEITLAHRGVLFLDEFPEFDRSVIEALRQPLEERTITISRAKGTITFPAQCIFIASMNPCPCGTTKEKGCVCTQKNLERYSKKISGPIADRIDIWLNIDKVDYSQLGNARPNNETSDTIKGRIINARIIQAERFRKYNSKKCLNSEIDVSDIEKLIGIEDEAKQILIQSAEKLNLSGRAFHRIQKVSRTIADLANKNTVSKDAILEAIQYRDRRSA